MAQRQSLEDAIRAAQLDVAEHDDKVVIDRSMFASRKRGRIAVVSKSRDLIGSPLGEVDGNSEAHFWKTKYETLRSERREAEEDLEQQVEIGLQREAKLDALNTLLNKKVELLQAGAVTSADATELMDKLDQLRKLVKFYENLTATTVKMDHTSSEEYTVTVQHSAKPTHTTRFKIEMSAPDEGGDRRPAALGFSFEPDPNVNMHLLPEYLHRGLECESGMMPVILADILTKLYFDGTDPQNS